MADIWIALPLLLLAAGALLTLIIGAMTRDRGAGTAIGVAVSLGVALWTIQTPPQTLAAALGLSASPTARLFTVLFALSACATLLLSHRYNEQRGIDGEEYPATVLFTTFGGAALASATTLLTLFLGLEALTFGFYILTAIDLKRGTSAEAGLKYLLVGALSSAFLAFGIALLYCMAGTLAITDAVQLTLVSGTPNPITLAGWGLLLVGVAFKLSLVPFHLWTPDVYQGAPAPVTGFLSGVSKGAGILTVLLLLPAAHDTALLRIPLWCLALLSVTVGNLAALMQSSVRRMLAYSSIAQMGYVVLALLSGQSGGYRAAIYYAVAYAAMSLAAFGAIAVLERNGCGDTLDGYRGLGSSRPFAAGILALALFSLAGIPPTAGFTGKFLIFTAAIRSGEIPLAVIGILTAAVSIYYYLRLVVSLYLHPPSETGSAAPAPMEIVVLALLAGVIILLGIWPSLLPMGLGGAFP